MQGSFIVKTLNVSIGGGVPIDTNSLVDMPPWEDVTPIINSLQGLHLNSPQSNFEAVLSSLTL